MGYPFVLMFADALGLEQPLCCPSAVARSNSLQDTIKTATCSSGTCACPCPTYSFPHSQVIPLPLHGQLSVVLPFVLMTAGWRGHSCCSTTCVQLLLRLTLNTVQLWVVVCGPAAFLCMATFVAYELTSCIAVLYSVGCRQKAAAPLDASGTLLSGGCVEMHPSSPESFWLHFPFHACGT